MAEAIRMPLLSDTMKEGVIAAWHKKVGDKVKSDDVIADVETDKATMEVMPYVDGTLLYIGVEQGKAAKVNDVIAVIGKEGEDYKAALGDGGAQNTNAPQQPAQGQQNGGQQPAVTAAQGEANNQQQNAGQQAPDQNNQQHNNQAQAAQQPQANPAPAPQQNGGQQDQNKPQAAPPNPGDATVVRMPLLSDTMKEGKIVAWHKKVGDKVKSDDVIAEVETDKATMEVMPYADGTLLYIGVQEGNAAKVNDIIAIVGKEGTNVDAYLQQGNAGGQQVNAGQEQQPAQQGNQQAATQSQQPQQQPQNNQQQAAPQQAPAPQTQNNQQQSTNTDERVKASPLAKKLAEEKGIDIAQVKGSGDNGRIIKRDVDSYEPPKQQPTQQQGAAQQGQKAGAAVPQFAANGQEGHTDQPLSQMRKIIAQRLSESMFSAPHFYLRMTITMDNAMEARKSINAVSPVKVSFNDLIIKACAMALRKHPEVNSSWMGDFIRQNQHIHIGTAVAVDEGLIVPVIKFADQKSLSQIADDSNKLIEKARTKKLQPQEFTGNTFTVSNLGMMDIDEFTAIINPPDSCILAIGKIAATPVVEDGEVVIRQLLKLTLSCDHRVVDGAIGSRFLQTLKAHLENPVTMLV